MQSCKGTFAVGMLLLYLIPYTGAAYAEGNAKATSAVKTTLVEPSVVESSWQDSANAAAAKYVGNINSGKFHRLTCIFARIMSKDKVINFDFRRQAIDAGQTPCRWCLPPVVTSVRGSLIPKGNRKVDTPLSGTCKHADYASGSSVIVSPSALSSS